MAASPNRLLGRLSLDTSAGALASERRIRLLEAVAAHGSITRAAKAVPLSYKAAWDALDAMNNLAERPLVARSTGGRQGGGTTLTDAGRELVAMYRALEGEQQRALDRLAPQRARQRAAADRDPRQMQRLLRRLAVRTSARNQFAGTVTQLLQSKVSVEVCIALDLQTSIVAGVTRESAEALSLATGSPVLALVKASSVLLAQGDARTSARNHLTGKVSRIVAGPIGAEVTLALPAGRSVTAGITRESLDRLGLAKGQPASALFKASSVILVALD
jgi:molybdate transport system regulatory protein